MTEQQKYLGNIVLRTKSFITTNYQKLPLKAPKFVENIIVYADGVAQPYIQKATDVVDENINRNIQMVSQCFNEEGNKLKQKGKELTDQLRENSKKALDQGVDLAKNNGATQFVLHTCDSVANKVFSSIEGNVAKMQKAVLKKNKSESSDQSYHQRTVKLAHDVQEITKGLWVLLKNGVEQCGGQKVQQLKLFVTINIQKYLNATLFTCKVIVIQPISLLYTTSLTELKSIISILKEKYNNQQLRQHLIEQLTNIRDIVQKTEYEEFKALLINALVQTGVIIKQHYQKSIETFKNSLNEPEDEVQEQPQTEITQPEHSKTD